MGIETEETKAEQNWVMREGIIYQYHEITLPAGCTLSLKGFGGDCEWEGSLEVSWDRDAIGLGMWDSLEEAKEEAPIVAQSRLIDNRNRVRDVAEALSAIAATQLPPQLASCVCGHDGNIVPIEFDLENYVCKWVPGCELVKAKAEIAALVALAKAQESLLAAYRTHSNQRSGANAATKVKDTKAKLAALGIEL